MFVVSELTVAFCLISFLFNFKVISCLDEHTYNHGDYIKTILCCTFTSLISITRFDESYTEPWNLKS